MKRVATVALATLLVATLAGCGKHDNRVDALGKRIVAELRAQPAVADARYEYVNTIDLRQHLGVTVIVRDSHTDPATAQSLVELVTKDTWLTPTNLYSMSVVVDTNPTGPPGDRTSLAGDDLPLPADPSAREDHADVFAMLEAKYGPRPSK